MSMDRTPEYLIGLITELRKLPKETGWLEFKENNSNPEEIGEYLSALSNTAVLEGKANAYIVWGIRNTTHEVVGTAFNPRKEKKGNEALENWLVRLLEPRIHFRFHEVVYKNMPVVLLEIPRASSRPVQFKGVEWIRVGSYRQTLRNHPQLERDLWRVFEATPFEELIAAERLGEPDVLTLLDYPSYFDLLELPLPATRRSILTRLAEDRMIARNQSGGWDITNLGGILLAKNLDDFKGLSRKAVRVVVYGGKGRLNPTREHIANKGYASGFESLVEYINALLPRNEVIKQALRKEVPMYPEQAIRELVANALIHQDYSVTGAGPMIEIFDSRMEITNPGIPLVSTDRFLDSPPRSRNETLASFMRRIRVCEERGSGIDKVVFLTEDYQLPAPLFESPEGFTRTVLFAHKAFRDMDRADRIRACYLHACLRYVELDPMTNSTLRKRFGIEEQNSAMASRVIHDALEDGCIKPFDPAQGKKYARYLPHWA